MDKAEAHKPGTPVNVVINLFETIIEKVKSRVLILNPFKVSVS